MAENIGSVSSYSNPYVGTYTAGQRNNSSVTDNDAPSGVTNNNEDTQVDPDLVLDFLANNNYFINIPTSNPIDADLGERVADYMEKFEIINDIVIEEFGAEKADTIMKFIMNYLIAIMD